MKTTAAPILRRYGFRSVLIWNGLISAFFIATFAWFRADTPAWAMLALLLSGGFFRSLEFTSLNSLSYAEVRNDRMSAATSFASMAQQLAASVGVGTGAMLLHYAMVLRGGHQIAVADFVPAFLIVAGLSACSAFVFFRLEAGAGRELLAPRAAGPAKSEPRSQPS